MKMNQKQLTAIKAYWEGCLQRKKEAATVESNFSWATGQMDGFERALSIVVEGDPFPLIEAAVKGEEPKDDSKYVRACYEVHRSEDGQKWFKSAGTSGTEKKDLVTAKTQAKHLSESCRHVRVVYVERHVTILEKKENEKILSKQQIATLLEAGTKALKDLPGVSVNEGISIGFGSAGCGIYHGPTRVTTWYNVQSVLGKRPSEPAARRTWDTRAKELTLTALKEIEERLVRNGISYHRAGNSIELLWG